MKKYDNLTDDEKKHHDSLKTDAEKTAYLESLEKCSKTYYSVVSCSTIK